uniref:Transposase n=1 Tax=Thermosporothrix sp. COM3 TaxID=2490863 RepID=A0A455SMF1_9CHLR|nr:transposase [Thermosporothrix sp. COM3]
MAQEATRVRQFPFALSLNSQARQAAADRAWAAISRFYEHCRLKTPGKKGYPQFQHDCRSVEDKQTGWKLDPDKVHIRFTDGCGIGRLRLIGSRDSMAFPLSQIKRVRQLRRADGYSCQFAVATSRRVEHQPSGKQVGIDLGLRAFFTDSEGNTVAPPQDLRKAERRLKRLHRRLSKTQKRSRNRRKARQALSKASLKVQRQREDVARKQASALISSHDVIAYEALQIRHLVKNRHLAKSIADAAWDRFLWWVKYDGTLHRVPVIGGEPASTSQDCSRCGQRVKKSLSVRTHLCPGCGLLLDRDHNAALNILQKALSGTVGQTGTDEGASSNASGQPAATRRRTAAPCKQAG